MPRKVVTHPSSAEHKLIAQLAARITTPQERSEAGRERRYQAERDLLVAILSRIWPAHITRASRRTLVWHDVICIHSPAGPLAWGLPPDRAHLFAHLERAACKWDGHGASERDARLRALLRLDPGDLVSAPARQVNSQRRTTRSKRNPK